MMIVMDLHTAPPPTSSYECKSPHNFDTLNVCSVTVFAADVSITGETNKSYSNAALSPAPLTCSSHGALSLVNSSAAIPEFNKLLSCSVPAWISFNPLNISELPSL